jgi:hypoxanthine phosphoribosyltransferase
VLVCRNGKPVISPGGSHPATIARESLGPEPPTKRDPLLGPVVVSEQQIQQRVRELGQQITRDYSGRVPLLVGVLKGACLFLSDLARAIELPLEVDFMAVSSYGSSTRTSGVVRIVKDLDIDLAGRHVLIVEDIVDSGLTLSYLRRNLAARNPASLEVVALLVKDGLQSVQLDLAYEGFHIPPAFVVGYGLDVGERYRNLRFVATYAGSTAAGSTNAAAGSTNAAASSTNAAAGSTSAAASERAASLGTS